MPQNLKNTLSIAMIISFFLIINKAQALPYLSGETLNPACSPGDANCTVLSPRSVAGKTGVVVLDKNDVGLNNVENTALSTWAGSTNINSLGTITSGIWNGSHIAPSYIDISGSNSGQVLSSNGTSTIWRSISGYFVGGENGGSNRILGNTDDYNLSFITNNINRLSIKNDGNIGIGITNPARKLEVIGNMGLTADVISSGGGLNSALRLQTNAYGDATGNQWGGLFSTVYTVAGQSNVSELDGILTLLTHTQGFTLPLWKGIETGGGLISGAGTAVTKFYALDVNLPQVTNGASVATATAIYIHPSNITGITNHYAILSEAASPSVFSGEFTVNNIATLKELKVGRTTDTTSVITMNDGNGIVYEITNGATANGEFTIKKNLAGGGTIYYALSGGNHKFINGNVGIGTTSPTAKLHVSGDTFRIELPKTPASASAACNTGDHVWDINYLYVCVDTNTWKRSALTSW